MNAACFPAAAEAESAVPAENVLRRCFSPIVLNGLELPNRILMSSMHMNFEGHDQYERFAHFYRLRAAQGPALIVTAGCSPDLAGQVVKDGFRLDSDELIGEHRKIVDAVHAVGGSKIVLQLLHFGREAFHGQLVAPSPLRLEGNFFTPHELSHEQIVATIDAYGSAAARAVAAGYDAIELLFSQGFLIHQFLSAHTNHRTDSWGGDFEQRLRFARAVAAAVRNAVGSGYPVIFRIPCLDLVDGGLSFAESLRLIEVLQDARIDLLNISIGWHESNVPTIANVVPQAGFAAAAARVKAAFPHLTTCVSNRINDLRHAEELLIEGVADMVAMARPFLADREIVAKSAGHRFDEINYCIACNQDCLDQVFLGKVVGCAVNPECSSEREGEAPPPLAGQPAIAVVGGGLAGMAAAFMLARRGARVTLFESKERLGGQLLLAARVPGKSEFLRTVQYYETQLRLQGVDIRLGARFDAEKMAAGAWRHVVVATGTEPKAWLPPAGTLPRIVGYRELLRDDLPVEFPVVVIGGGGVACDMAKLLLSRQSRLRASEGYLAYHGAESLVGPLGPAPEAGGDRSVTLLQRSSKKFAYKIGHTVRWIVVDELKRRGVRLLRGVSIKSCGDDAVVVATMDGKEIQVSARTIVVAVGQHAHTATLVAALTKAAITHSVVGAASVGEGVGRTAASISSSIRSGYEAALALVLDQDSGG